MKRNTSDGKNKKNNWEHLKKVKCPKCNNDKAWTSRGLTSPAYVFKCTKCKHIIR
jgi:endogenous inhibitor of DNA gyrase (YacG/DUF329 family)